MKRFILMFFGMLLLFSCDLTINKDITSQYLVDGLAGGNLDLYLQGTQIFRYKGKPGIVTIPVGNADLSEYESCFVLHVETGTTQETTVSSATIKLDGLEVLNSSDFSKNVGRQYTFEVCDLTPTSVLTVEIAGKPGSYLNIWIEGKLANSGTFTDSRDGKVYKWVKIGNQTWMAENLAYLPAIYPPENNSSTDPRYYVYDFYGTNKIEAMLTDNFKNWGVLYNITAAYLNSTCPEGWHLPSDEEWNTLCQYITDDHQEDHLGPWGIRLGGAGGFWLGIGRYLKTNTGWITETEVDVDGNTMQPYDQYGFSALPAGSLHCQLATPNETFFNAGTRDGGFWSSSTGYPGSDMGFHDYYLTYWLAEVQIYKDRTATMAFSIRCIKDN